MCNKRKTIASTFFLLFFLCSYADLSAQDEQKASAEDNMLQLDEVTVTAHKQEENLQEVSTSLTALGKLEIEDNQINSITDVAKFSPNFIHFDTGIIGVKTPSIRGIHEDGSGGSPVGLFIDGIPILSITGFNAEMLDVERVEVLRGPQGTLYGSNTEIGVINIITQQPGNDFLGKVSVEAGEDNKRKGLFNVQGPIQQDRFFYSLSGLHYEKDGYIKNNNTGQTENNRKYSYFKGNLRWTPASTVDVSLVAHKLAHDDGDQNIALGPAGAKALGVEVPGDREVNSDLVGWNKSSSDMQALKVIWDMEDHIELQSVTARREYRSYYLNDWDYSKDATMHKEMDNTHTRYSQELKLSWTGQNNTLVTGLYFDRNHQVFKETNDVSGELEEDHTTKGSTLGLFAHNEWQVSKKWNVITGIRFDRANSSFEDRIRSRDIDKEWSETSPKVGLEHNFTDHVMLYATVAKGYRAGGFNDHAAPEDPKSYEQETLISYEVGTKSEFFNKRLLFNFGAYYMDIDDMQVRIDNASNPQYNYTENASKARSVGIEIDAKALLTETLTLAATYGSNHTEFVDYKGDDGNYDGNHNPYSPPYTYSVTLTQRSPGGFFGSVTVSGIGELYLDKQNEYKVDGYDLVDTKVGWEFKDVDLYVYANNLLDKEYDAEGFYGGYYTVYSPPREAGVRINYRF